MDLGVASQAHQVWLPKPKKSCNWGCRYHLTNLWSSSYWFLLSWPNKTPSQCAPLYPQNCKASQIRSWLDSNGKLCLHKWHLQIHDFQSGHILQEWGFGAPRRNLGGSSGQCNPWSQHTHRKTDGGSFAISCSSIAPYEAEDLVTFLRQGDWLFMFKKEVEIREGLSSLLTQHLPAGALWPGSFLSSLAPHSQSIKKFVWVSGEGRQECGSTITTPGITLFPACPAF